MFIFCRLSKVGEGLCKQRIQRAVIRGSEGESLLGAVRANGWVPSILDSDSHGLCWREQTGTQKHNLGMVKGLRLPDHRPDSITAGRKTANITSLARNSRVPVADSSICRLPVPHHPSSIVHPPPPSSLSSAHSSFVVRSSSLFAIRHPLFRPSRLFARADI